MRKFYFFLSLTLLFTFLPALGQTEEASRRVYALTVPYLTVKDDISFYVLSCYWDGSCDSPEGLPEGTTLMIPEEERENLAGIFGKEPDADHISTIPSAELFTEEHLASAWMIIPFEDIEPRRKVLTIDGMNILSNQFDPNTWPLTALVGAVDAGTDPSMLPVSNRDASKLTTVVLTGVTAMVRGTASYMDLDPLYPASLIREPLVEADILHVNNEVPFAAVCDIRDHYNGLRFCSKVAYLNLLLDIGTDVIELDGDHFQDYGDDAVEYTLDIYDEAGLPYYGGGHNKTEAQQPFIIEHNGNTFGFLGCNGKEIGYAAASDTRPGAVHCDIDLMTKQIRELREEGIIPIVTFQHLEVYQVKPVEQVRADFEAVRDAGAIIVSGSQSHIPMEFDVSQDHFVHYGLGNLFFDQAFFLPETADAFIDRHVFYDGKYINTELLTIRFTNNALSHYMTEDERGPLLSRIFEVSEVEGLTDDGD